MTDRKSFLRTDRLHKGFRISENEWEKIAPHLPKEHQAAFRAKCAHFAWWYCLALALEPATNPTLATQIKLYVDIASAAARLKGLLTNVKGIDFFYPKIEPRLGIRATDPDVLETSASFQKDLEACGATLTYLQNWSADWVSFFSEPQNRSQYSPKHGVVGFMLDYWMSELGRKVPKSCAGRVADFVVVASNPILRLGGQQIASTGSARALITDLLSGAGVL